MPTATPISFETFSQQGQYVGYSYSYPHKTAYRAFEPAIRLRDLWEGESKDSLFLYLHIPFCEVRCGFCNLFTYSQPDVSFTASYLAGLKTQMRVVRDEIRDCTIARVAIGGGTPTFLDASELDELFRNVAETFGADGLHVPISCEVSPSTLTAEKAKVLRDHNVERISMGVQSFNIVDVGRMGRPQSNDDVARAIDLIQNSTKAQWNVDLIYGADSQTEATWLDSLKQAVKLAPDEVYLYPLYVRPLTGLGKTGKQATDLRPKLYRMGRDFLQAEGYRQVSMRMFERPRERSTNELEYCCQRDGMIGLGCGARSYTSGVHYGHSYAVKQRPIFEIIREYAARTSDEHRLATLGIMLDEEDQKRRYLLLSLLLVNGFSMTDYSARFGVELLDDFAELSELVQMGMANIKSGRFHLTPVGLEWSDAIGPWLYSERVRGRMESYPWID